MGIYSLMRCSKTVGVDFKRGYSTFSNIYMNMKIYYRLCRIVALQPEKAGNSAIRTVYLSLIMNLMK